MFFSCLLNFFFHGYAMFVNVFGFFVPPSTFFTAQGSKLGYNKRLRFSALSSPGSLPDTLFDTLPDTISDTLPDTIPDTLPATLSDTLSG